MITIERLPSFSPSALQASDGSVVYAQSSATPHSPAKMTHIVLSCNSPLRSDNMADTVSEPKTSLPDQSFKKRVAQFDY